MAETGVGGDVYVLTAARVQESIAHLLERDTHPYFIAYLHLRRQAGISGTTTSLDLNLAELGSTLAVLGGPDGKPYLRPFWKGTRDAHQEWLNANLAGSYSPSSLRGTPAKVVEVDAEGRFSLREDHPGLALHHLLLDEPLSAVAVAAFLLRDYGVVADHTPLPSDLVALFRSAYGYTAEDDVEFELLYETEWAGGDGPWFEAQAPSQEADG